MPVRLPGDFEVVKLRADMGVPGDANQFVRGFQQPAALTAEVRDVQAVVFRSGLAEGDQLLRPRVKRGGIDQRRGDAYRAFGHRVAHQLLHPLQLVGRGRTIGIADFVNAHRRGADKGRDIAGHASLNEVVQIFAQRGPLDAILDVSLLLAHLPLHCVIERPHGRAFPQNLERHALADVALRAAIFDEGPVGPTQHVDESRCHCETPGVKLRPAARAPQLADGRDGLPVDGNVAGHRRPAAAVVNRAVADEEVVISAHSTLPFIPALGVSCSRRPGVWPRGNVERVCSFVEFSMGTTPSHDKREIEKGKSGLACPLDTH